MSASAGPSTGAAPSDSGLDYWKFIRELSPDNFAAVWSILSPDSRLKLSGERILEVLQTNAQLLVSQIFPFISVLCSTAGTPTVGPVASEPTVGATCRSAAFWLRSCAWVLLYNPNRRPRPLALFCFSQPPLSDSILFQSESAAFTLPHVNEPDFPRELALLHLGLRVPAYHVDSDRKHADLHKTYWPKSTLSKDFLRVSRQVLFFSLS